MTKAEAIADPNSCWNKAKDDEHVFVLVGRDEAAPETIQAWCSTRIRMEKNDLVGDPQIHSALECATLMVRSQIESRLGKV